MKKQDLPNKTRIAWIKTGKPGDGWEIYQEVVRGATQRQIADMFDVATSTSWLWDKEYKEKYKKEVV